MEEAPKSLTAEQIQARIADLDRQIIEDESPSRLAAIAAENDLGTTQDDTSQEEELNDARFAQARAKIEHLRAEKQELQSQLDNLQKAK